MDNQSIPRLQHKLGDRLRLLLVSDSFLPRIGGIEMQVADLATSLRRAGHYVRVLTTTEDRFQASSSEVRRVPVPVYWRPALGLSPGCIEALRAELQSNYDVLHVHMSIVSPLALAAVAVARAQRIPTVITLHSVLLKSVIVLRALDRALHWSQWQLVLTAVSDLVAMQLRQAVPCADVTVLPNGIDFEEWHRRRDLAPKVVDEAAREIRVVSAIRLRRKKRPLALLRAFKRARDIVRAHGRRLTLTIAGDGPARWLLQTYIACCGLDGEATLCGAVSRDVLQSMYADADIFVLPTIRESFGIAALEARVAGLPVIAMRGSGAVGFLRDDETALIAADDAAIVQHLVRLALDDSLRHRLTEVDPVLDRYDWQQVLADHVACYHRAMSLVR
jgi:glycosyltransferase involved in cell wall biosynthesis